MSQSLFHMPGCKGSKMKRKANSEAAARKRYKNGDKQNETATSFQESDSVQELARAYRVATARLPVSALDPAWSIGKNRPLDERHASKLCSIFNQGGLNRKAKENYLRVLCSAADVERMRNSLDRERMRNSLDRERMMNSLDRERIFDMDDDIPYFRRWNEVNNGRKVELMAGQHRVRALDMYMEKTGCSKEEAWWTCDFYDKDRLPHDLNVKLRVNRRDPSMPDSHGQIWAQLVLAASQNPELFRGKNLDVEKQMLDFLQLSREVRFPAKRLVTLWKNARWRVMITRWCETGLGMATFQISTWEWMSTCRIDDFWFSAFRSVLSTLTQLPGVPADEMPVADWARLSESLPAGYTDAQVSELFYPDRESRGATKRRPGFLSMLRDEAYEKVCKHIQGTPRLRFADVHSLLRTSKEDGRIMVQVLNHVIAWLNPNPTTVHDRRDNNKPPLWNDLVPALQSCSEERIQSAAGRVNTEVDAHAGGETAAMLLQQEVLTFVRDNAAEFKTSTAKQYLDSVPSGTDGPAYARRFLDRAWRHVLAIVRQYVGPDFQPTWVTSPPCDSQGALLEPEASLTRAICRASETVPEIAQNPALSTERALEALAAAIDETVLEWASRQCQVALEDGSGAAGTAWSAATAQQVREAQSKYANDLAERTRVQPRASVSSIPAREDPESAPVLTSAQAEPSTSGGGGQARTKSPCQPQRRRLRSIRGRLAGNEDAQVAEENPGRAAPQSSPSPFQSGVNPGGIKNSQQGKDRRPPAWTRGVKATRRS